VEGLDPGRRSASQPESKMMPIRVVSATPQEWSEAIRRYRDPMHPERPPHPKKVARTLHSSNRLDLDPAMIARECELAGVDPEEVQVELDALRIREETGTLGFEDVKTATRSFNPGRVADLRGLGGVLWKVVGMSYWLQDGERDSLRVGWFVLHREPGNPHDKNAVAVYLDCRKIGYLTVAKAKTYSPILASISAEAYEVAGQIDGRDALVRLPPPTTLQMIANGRNH
jgi:hypothetical protein